MNLHWLQVSLPMHQYTQCRVDQQRAGPDHSKLLYVLDFTNVCGVSMALVFVPLERRFLCSPSLRFDIGNHDSCGFARRTEVEMRVALVVLLMLVLPSFVCAASLQERISAKEQPVSEEVLFDMERDVGRSIEAEADISIMRMADSIASTVVGISAHKSCPSLGEMAAPCASRLYSDLISKRATLCGNSTVAPEEPAVHDARKALLVFRTFLDVFAPTYPSLAVHGEEESDMWGMIRDDLDQVRIKQLARGISMPRSRHCASCVANVACVLIQWCRATRRLGPSRILRTLAPITSERM